MALAAVKGDGLSCQPVAAVGDEERRKILQLLDAADPSHRIGTLSALGRPRARTEALACAFGRNDARRDGVEPDAVVGPFGGERHGHGVDPGFAHDRRHHIGAAVVDPGHYDRNDVAAMPAGDPTAANGVGDVEGAVQHDVGDGVETARAQIFGARDKISGGVVDEVGERARGEDVADHGVDRRGIADVDPIGADLAAVLAHEFGGGRLAHRFAPPADEDFGAESEKFFGHALAQPGAAAGHQDAPAAQQSVVEHALPSQS